MNQEQFIFEDLITENLNVTGTAYINNAHIINETVVNLNSTGNVTIGGDINMTDGNITDVKCVVGNGAISAMCLSGIAGGNFISVGNIFIGSTPSIDAIQSARGTVNFLASNVITSADLAAGRNVNTSKIYSRRAFANGIDGIDLKVTGVSVFLSNVDVLNFVPSAILPIFPTVIQANQNNDNFDFRVDGQHVDNVLFVDGSANGVGIGTATPSEKLDVLGKIRTNDTVETDNIDSDSGSGITLLDDTSVDGDLDADNITASDTIITDSMDSVSGSGITIIDDVEITGNVGIGIAPASTIAIGVRKTLEGLAVNGINLNLLNNREAGAIFTRGLSFAVTVTPDGQTTDRTATFIVGADGTATLISEAGTPHNLFGGQVNGFRALVRTGKGSGATGDVNITNAYMFHALRATASSGSNILTSTAFFDAGQIAAGTNWGLGINTQSYINGNLMVGSNNVPTENLTVVGNANVTGNFTGDFFYGEMWFHNDTSFGVRTVISTQNVWVNVTGFNQTTDSGQTLNGFTHTQNEIVAKMPGKYKADFSISFGNAGNNQEYQVVIAVNGVFQNQTETHRKIGAAGDVGTAGGGGFIDLVVDDVITLQVANRDGTGDIGVHAANVNLVRIGD